LQGSEPQRWSNCSWIAIKERGARRRPFSFSGRCPLEQFGEFSLLAAIRTPYRSYSLTLLHLAAIMLVVAAAPRWL